MSKKEEELNVNPSILIDVNDTACQSVCFDRCENQKEVTLEDQHLSNVGRFLTVSLTVKNVCPNKQIAVGIKLYETTGGVRVIKGHKTFAYMHSERTCKDVTLANIHFVMPEEIAETCDKTKMCSKRTFDIETTSHYVDLDSHSM